MKRIPDDNGKINFSINPLFEILRADGSIVVNKALVHAIGLHEAILFSELISRFNYFAERGQLTKDGYFFNTINDLQAATCLNAKQQRKALNKLEQLKLISTRLQGMPATRHFKINDNMAALAGYLRSGKVVMKNYKDYTIEKSPINQQLGNISQTRCAILTKLDSQNMPTNNTKGNNIKKEEEEEPASTLFNIYLKNLNEKTGNKVTTTNRQNINALNKLVNLCGQEEAAELLKLWFATADQGTAAKGWPVGFLINQLTEYKNKLQEYQEEQRREAAAAERNRQLLEEERQQEEKRRQEEARRAALTDEQRKLEDIASEREKINMLMGAWQQQAAEGNQKGLQKVQEYQQRLQALDDEEAQLLPIAKKA